MKPGVENADSLIVKLTNIMKRTQRDSVKSVVVGYSAHYAIYVHENVEMKLRGKPRPKNRGVYWGPHGEAKFLEKPAREETRNLKAIVSRYAEQGLPVSQALYKAGEYLLRCSQKIVPVDTGYLRASGYVQMED